MFVILQKYDFSSKSQLYHCEKLAALGCLWYCKSTIFQANHNDAYCWQKFVRDVCDTAKVRFFKQITTSSPTKYYTTPMFVILQKYDFSSKSQHIRANKTPNSGCLWYCKSTIFQANHNHNLRANSMRNDVCDTAKVRFFKQITTDWSESSNTKRMFVILQKYDFSSKSQQWRWTPMPPHWCLWYCKSTIFQANHNIFHWPYDWFADVCDTAKVRFFKQITTNKLAITPICMMFVILQKYDFSSKSQCLNGLPFGASSCSRYCKSAIFQANHKWLSLPTYGEWWCAWPSPLAVGRGRCVGYLFGAYYLFLLKCLVSWFYFVSLH